MPGCAGTSARSCRCAVAAGGIFSAFRTRRMVDVPTRWPSFSSSPWIRWYPQPLFSVASRSISAAISALTGGRPVRFRYVHLRVTRRRCQRRTVPGVTSRYLAALPAGAGSARRGPPGRPSRAGAGNWRGAARRPRAAVRATRRPWKPTTGRAESASRRAGRRRDRAGAGIRMIMMPYG